MVSVTGTSTRFTKPMYFWYQLGTGIHRFLPSNTGVEPVPTGTEPYRIRYIRYWYLLLGFSITVFSVPVGTELIISRSNAAMQIICFKLNQQINSITFYNFREQWFIIYFSF
ncbi:hypothetical protein Hanom_Chr15g01346821 [Helianthus anomalus]